MKLLHRLGTLIVLISFLLVIDSQLTIGDVLANKSTAYSSEKISIFDLKSSGEYFSKQPDGSVKDTSLAQEFCNVNPDQNREAILYENDDFTGLEASLGDNVPNCPYDDRHNDYQRPCLKEDFFGNCIRRFNDKASSLRIRSGYVSLFVDKDYNGEMRLYGPGRVISDDRNDPKNWESFVLTDFNDTVSSAIWSEEKP